MFAVAIFITYGIQFYVPIEILWPSLERNLTHHLLTTYGEYLLRYFFLFVTCEFSNLLQRQLNNYDSVLKMSALLMKPISSRHALLTKA